MKSLGVACNAPLCTGAELLSPLGRIGACRSLRPRLSVHWCVGTFVVRRRQAGMGRPGTVEAGRVLAMSVRGPSFSRTASVVSPLAGTDSGFFKDAYSPSLPYQAGYLNWGGAAWRQPTDPARWNKYSVVWFSQQMTHSLGESDPVPGFQIHIRIDQQVR